MALSSNNNRLRRLKTDLRTLEAKLTKANASATKMEICDQMIEAATLCKNRLRRWSLRDLDDTVKSLYSGIVTDGSSVQIDPKTLLPEIVRGSVSGLATGGGQAQILVLCFIIALAKIRQEINLSLAREFNVSRFQEQAFFMDSVFGQMQAEYTRDIARFLPKHFKQLVLLVAGQQWSKEIAEGLRGKISNAYGLKLHSPKVGVGEMDFSFKFNKKSYRLFAETPSASSPFSMVLTLK